MSNTGSHFSLRTTEPNRVIVSLANEIALVRKKRATGRHKTSMNRVSLTQWGDVRICLQPTWCCPTDKSGILLQAFGNLLLWVSSCSLLSNATTLKKYPHTHSFSSFTLMVASSLVSCRDRPGVANAACLLPLACLKCLFWL